MSRSDEAKRLFPDVLSLRFKIALVSLLSLVVTTACSRLRLRGTEEPDVLCYIVAPPTDTPTPVVLCYEVMLPTETPVPGDPALSYTHTPTPTLTPTPVCYTPPPSATSVPPQTPTVGQSQRSRAQSKCSSSTGQSLLSVAGGAASGG